MRKWDFDWSYWFRQIENYSPWKNVINLPTKFDRPSWDNYFMSMAMLTAQRSCDISTKHGAVLVDRHNRVISTGYNSYLPGLPDEQMPNNRPDKYDWMIHAEDNMINQAGIDLISTPDLRVYITGRPCYPCLGRLINARIFHIIMLEDDGRWGAKSLETDPYKDADKWLWLANRKDLKMEWIKFEQGDHDWIKRAFSL